MGGPTVDAANEMEAQGIRLIDVRHEQAAVMMAHAYARMKRRPGVCMAASGPGVTNLITGMANAWADSAPVIAIGGSAPVGQTGRMVFQEVDQVALMTPITRWAQRCHDGRRIPQLVEAAFNAAYSGRPGTVYLDMPGDILYADAGDVQVCEGTRKPTLEARAGERELEQAIALLRSAERPVVFYGSGVLWSSAEANLKSFVETFQTPFWSTPMARGCVPEDHPLHFSAARSEGFRNADVIVQIGTRQSYVADFVSPPRWSATAKLIQIDIDPTEIGRNRHADVPLIGDAAIVLDQLVQLAAADGGDRERSRAWRERLAALNTEKVQAAEGRLASDAEPIHPLRLSREVRDAIPRDTVLVVDGTEILNFARQSIPFYGPFSLNSGPFGTMGVGLPLGLGAKVALPDQPVVVLHGDGSFGLNAMEMDTAIRHNIPVVCIISNNGGWSARQPEKYKAGRELGHTRYDEMFTALGCHTSFVEKPADLAPAIRAALDSNKPAVVNVVTEPTARSKTAKFADYET